MEIVISLKSGLPSIFPKSKLSLICLGLEVFSSPDKVIAADVSGNHQVTAADLIESRKLILGLYTELPNNSSWIFVNANSNVSLETLSSDNGLTFSKEEFPLQVLNVLGIKVGDVNCSALSK